MKPVFVLFDAEMDVFFNDENERSDSRFKSPSKIDITELKKSVVVLHHKVTSWLLWRMDFWFLLFEPGRDGFGSQTVSGPPVRVSNVDFRVGRGTGGFEKNTGPHTSSLQIESSHFLWSSGKEEKKG